VSLDFSPLLGALDDLLAIHGELVELGAEKQGVIITGDITRLSAIVQRELRLMQQSASSDKKRGQAADNLAAEAGLEAPGMTALATLTDRETAAALTEKGHALRLLLAQQKDLNAKAKELLETHIQFGDMMLNLMVGPEDPLNNIYGAKGLDENNRRQTPGLFDKQV